MATDGTQQFALTPKGVEELDVRTYDLDVRLRNILFLVQKGITSLDEIIKHSIFPPEEVRARIDGLLLDRFIAAGEGGASSASATAQRPAVAAAPRAAARSDGDGVPAIDTHASVSQARFALCDFCLDRFGADAPEWLDALNGAADLARLQRVLDDIGAELRKKNRAQLPDLAACVREINKNRI